MSVARAVVDAMDVANERNVAQQERYPAERAFRAWIDGALDLSPAALGQWIEKNVSRDDVNDYVGDLVSDHLREAWLRGPGYKVEDYQKVLSQYREFRSVDDLPCDIVALEFVARHCVSRFADHPSLEEYAKRFPGRSDVDAELRRVCMGANRYVRLDVLGRGGLGVVRRAYDTHLRRHVAIKEIRSAEVDSGELIRRLRRESLLTARLNHPSIVSVHEFNDESSGESFYVMPVVGGVTFQEVIDKYHARLDDLERRSARLELNGLLSHLLQVCDAVSYAHSFGIAHRDLKPSNVKVGEFGETVVLDWGLARPFNCESVSAGESGDRASSKPKGFQRVIDTDVMSLAETRSAGTPGFVAPEQAARNYSDERSDVFSLGGILYCVLVGRSIAAKAEANHHTGSHSRDQKPRFERPRNVRGDIPRSLEAICLKMLEPNADDRYQSVNEARNDLARFLADEPIEALPDGLMDGVQRFVRRHRSVVAMIAAVALVATLSAIALTVLAFNANQGWARAVAKTNEVVALNEAADRSAYAVGMFQTQIAWNRAQMVRGGDVLNKFHPETGSYSRDYRGWEWYYLKRLFHSEKVLLKGHRGAVLCVTYGPGGGIIATGSDDRTARIWDADTGKTLQTLDGHLGSVNCLAFSPDGRTLASGSNDTKVKLWEVATGRLIETLEGHVLAVNGVAFSPGGDLLASAGSDSTIQVHDLASKKRLRVLDGHGATAFCVAFSKDGRQIATAGTDHETSTIRLWDLATGDVVKEYDGNSDYVAFCPSGRKLMYGGQSDLRVVDLLDDSLATIIAHPSRPNGSVVLADVAREFVSGASTTEMVRPSMGFQHASFNGKGTKIATADRRMVQIWDSATGKELGRFLGSSFAVAWHPEREEFASAGFENCVRIWSATMEQNGATFHGHNNRVVTLAFSPDGRRVASGSDDHSIKIWDAESGREIVTLGRHKYEYSQESPGQPAALRKVTTYEGHEQGVRRVIFSPDLEGRWLASAGQDRTVRVWEAATGKEILKLELPEAVTCVAWGPDGTTFVAGSWDDNLYLYECPSGRLIREFKGHVEDVLGVAFVDGGKRLASVSVDNTLRIWEVGTGREINKVERESFGEARCVAVSRDGRMLAVAGGDLTITLWDTESWRELRALKGHTGRIDDVAFSPDGLRLVSAGATFDDATVRVWDVAAGLELVNLVGSYAATFSPDGKRLAVGLMRQSEFRIYDSAPVDDQAYRTANIAPAAAKTKGGVPDESLKVLGAFSAKQLKRYQDAGALIGPLDDGREFLIVITSLPQGEFLLTEEAYAKRLEDEKRVGERPSPRRECVSIFDPGRFRLVSNDGRSVPGVLVSHWPPIYGGPGFDKGLYQSSSRRLDPHRRWGLAIAWPVDHTSVGEPWSIQFDERPAVPVPDAPLSQDRRLVPTAQEILHILVLRAHRLVQKGSYKDAVAVAEEIASDSQCKAEDIYNAACVCALAHVRARKDTSLGLLARHVYAEQLAANAVALLRRAVEKGFLDAEHFAKDRDLDELRNREDFQELLQRIDKARSDARKDAAL